MSTDKNEMIENWTKLVDAIREFIAEPLNAYAEGHCAPVEEMAMELMSWMEHTAHDDIKKGETPIRAFQVCAAAALEVAFYTGYEMGKRNMPIDFCDCKGQKSKAHLS